ncbi:PAS domain S-box protein [Rhodohalobacter sp. 8-1]|uniref:PAS domain S-box protein n=1 Tax=Rhodohalobacter sp. 8-1 TaxID=3131972 RepID=UPI0030ED5437
MSTKEIQIDQDQLQLLNAFPSPAAILDSDGDVIKTNEEWVLKEKQSCYLSSITLNGNFFNHCRDAAEQGSDDALKLIIGLRRILDGESTRFHSTYLSFLNGENKWFQINIRSLTGDLTILFADEITRNVKAIHELKDSRERYKQQFNHSINGIIIGTPSGEIIDANPSACSILGYSKAELRKIGRQGIMDEDNPLNKEASEIRDGQSYFEGEKRYIHKSGREVPIMASSVVFRDKDGKLSTINSFRDISKEKKIQKKLKSEQEFAKTAISSIPGVFFVLDKDGTFLEWNDVFLTELGYLDEDMFGMTPVEFFHPADKDLIAEKLAETITKGSAQVVARVLTKSGEERMFKLSARSFKNEDVNYVVGTGVDITEMVDAKNSSDYHFRMMNQLFENAPIGIVMIDHQNKIARVNNGFRTMFGYLNGDVVGSNVNELITDEKTRDIADEVSREAFKGNPSQFESVRYTKDGKEIPVLLSTVPVSDGENVIAVYGIYVDLTEQKQLEIKIKELLQRETKALQKTQDSLKEKEILLQEIHHRVKNNLAVIAGLLDLQLLEEKDQDVYRKLSEVQSRIFSIAKIHETLYQEKNVVKIQFDNYLKSFVKFLPQQGYQTDVISELNLVCDATTMNLNQAVPAGLMINELINVLLPDNSDGNLNLNLTSSEEKVKISLQGCGLKLENFKRNLDSEEFQYKLVEILVAQLNGTIDVNPEANFVSIVFDKTEAKGSSNAFF